MPHLLDAAQRQPLRTRDREVQTVEPPRRSYWSPVPHDLFRTSGKRSFVAPRGPTLPAPLLRRRRPSGLLFPCIFWIDRVFRAVLAAHAVWHATKRTGVAPRVQNGVTAAARQQQGSPASATAPAHTYREHPRLNLNAENTCHQFCLAAEPLRAQEHCDHGQCLVLRVIRGVP